MQVRRSFRLLSHTAAMTADSEILLVRHGETAWSASGRHTSVTDVALTDHGRAQASALAARLAAYDVALVLSSARRRALDTCTLAGFGDRAEIDDDLAEWDYGDYEGRTTAAIRSEVPGWTIFGEGAPGGESAAEVAARADRVIARCGAVDGTVAVFSHGHFLRVLGARWVGLEAADGRLLGLDTASLSVLGHEREQRVLRVWNG
jgi:broad specificity phosphatase PhoE